jgi:hypothetical protein
MRHAALLSLPVVEDCLATVAARRRNPKRGRVQVLEWVRGVQLDASLCSMMRLHDLVLLRCQHLYLHLLHWGDRRRQEIVQGILLLARPQVISILPTVVLIYVGSVC